MKLLNNLNNKFVKSNYLYLSENIQSDLHNENELKTNTTTKKKWQHRCIIWKWKWWVLSWKHPAIFFLHKARRPETTARISCCELHLVAAKRNSKLYFLQTVMLAYLWHRKPASLIAHSGQLSQWNKVRRMEYSLWTKHTHWRESGADRGWNSTRCARWAIWWQAKVARGPYAEAKHVFVLK